MTILDVPKVSTGEGWTEGSASYEKYLNPMSRKGAEALVEAMFKAYPPTPESDFLDCGAGTGIVISTMRQLYPSVPITAVDMSPGMLEIIKKLGLPGVKLCLSDATNLDRALVPKGGFTHASGALMIQFCGDKQPTMLQEFYDSLVPGGVAALSLSADINMAEPWHRACERLDPAYKRGHIHDEKAWKSFDQLEAAMLDIGFEDTQKVKVWMPMLTLKSKEDYLDFWFRGNHPAFSVRDMGCWKGNPEEVIPELLKVLEEYNDLSADIGCSSEIVVGRKPKLDS